MKKPKMISTTEMAIAMHLSERIPNLTYGRALEILGETFNAIRTEIKIRERVERGSRRNKRV